MIINNTYPLLFDDSDREDPILAMTKDDDRIVPLILEKERLLILHTRLHDEGRWEGEEHDACIIAWQLVEKALNACWVSPLN